MDNNQNLNKINYPNPFNNQINYNNQNNNLNNNQINYNNQNPFNNQNNNLDKNQINNIQNNNQDNNQINYNIQNNNHQGYNQNNYQGYNQNNQQGNIQGYNQNNYQNNIQGYQNNQNMQYNNPNYQYQVNYPIQNNILPNNHNYNINNSPAFDINNYNLYEELNNYSSIFIKQKKNVLEALSGCDLENTYYIYEGKESKEKNKKKKLFKIKEKSNIVDRLYIPIQCREIEFKVKKLIGNDEEFEVFYMKKKFTCSYLCLNNPTMTVYLTNKSNERIKIGKISDPWECCNYNFLIHDKDNNPIYRCISDCMQCAFWCNGYPCKSCEEAIINVYDYKTNNKLTEMKKKSKNCIQQAIFDQGNYFFKYSNEIKNENRVLLLSSAIFIDYLLFQDNQQNRNHHNGRYNHYHHNDFGFGGGSFGGGSFGGGGFGGGDFGGGDFGDGDCGY